MTSFKIPYQNLIRPSGIDVEVDKKWIKEMDLQKKKKKSNQGLNLAKKVQQQRKISLQVLLLIDQIIIFKLQQNG